MGGQMVQSVCVHNQRLMEFFHCQPGQFICPRLFSKSRSHCSHIRPVQCLPRLTLWPVRFFRIKRHKKRLRKQALQDHPIFFRCQYLNQSGAGPVRGPRTQICRTGHMETACNTQYLPISSFIRTGDSGRKVFQYLFPCFNIFTFLHIVAHCLLLGTSSLSYRRLS